MGEKRPLPRRVELPERVKQVRLVFMEQPEEAGTAWQQGYAVGGLGDRSVTERTPIAPCVNCGRWAEDPTRTAFDTPMPEHAFDNEEQKDPLCSECVEEALDEAVEEDTLALIERRLGIGEKDRDALRSFIETVFTDPKKILKVQELDNRVSGLEKQVTALWIALGIAGTLLAIVAAIAVAA